MITVFAHIKETKNPFYKDIDEVLNDIKQGSNKDFVEKIRTVKDKDKRNALKQRLKSICFSGKFSQRSVENCVEHSGFACLDFDDVDDPTQLREDLKENQYIYSAFISPSGNGVKAIVKIPPSIQDHKKYYEAICETFDTELDNKTKDVARVCYESYDPDLWINHDSKLWELKKEFTEVTYNSNYPDYFKITDEDKKVEVIKKWFNQKFTLNVGERNTNLFKLACGLNRAGMNKEDAIGTFKSMYSYGMKESELENIVKSAYKNTAEFNSLTLIDDNKVYEAERILRKGEQRARRLLKRKGLDEDSIDDIVDFKFEEDYLIFWNVLKNGNIKINSYKFRLFLENRGFFQVQLNKKEFAFVKVYNNIINEVNETNIKAYVLDYVEKINIDVYNHLSDNISKFTESYLNQLSVKELSMVRDTPNESYLFFKNKVVKVTKDNIEFIDYIDIGGLVWEDTILDRDFDINNDVCDYEQFIYNVCNKDDARRDVLECAIGYLSTTYKKQDEGIAVVLYDETLNDSPSGRAGKTLISDGISRIRKLVSLNGKEFDNKGNFPYEEVQLDTNVINFDDVERSFKFESLFSIITGNLTLKKKFQQPIVIPYEKSPKILFTSNYILSGDGDSHEDRKLEIELFRHYRKDYKPIDDFGRLFWSHDWTDDDWNSFYTYMIRNIQKYFNKGLLRSELKTSRIKKLIANTSEDFFEFCENEYFWKNDEWYKTKDILSSFNDGSREIPKGMNTRWFGKWLSSYFKFKEWEKKDTTNGGVRKFCLTNIDKEEENEILF